MSDGQNRLKCYRNGVLLQFCYTLVLVLVVEIAYLALILHLIDIIVLKIYRYGFTSNPIVPQELIVFEKNSMESALVTARR